MTNWAEHAAQMHLHHGIPLVDRHIDDHAIAHDACVTHHGVETTVDLDGLGDEVSSLIPIADVVAVHDGVSAKRANLFDHFLRR